MPGNGLLVLASETPISQVDTDSVNAMADHDDRDLSLDLEAFDLDALRRRKGVKWSWVDPARFPMWVADMDFPLASAITETLQDSIGRGDVGYPSGEEMEEVREAYCQRTSSLYGVRFPSELVELTSDVVQSVYLGLLAYSDPGEAVVVNTPAYPPFFSAVSETGRQLVEAPLRLGADGYALDLDQMESVIASSGAKVVILCNPHNPTGRVFSLAELEGLAEIASRHGLVVMSDEIHSDIVYPGSRHRPFASVSEEAASRTVTLASASKSFNMAGLRCATVAFGSSELKRRFDAFPEHARGGLSVLGMRATLAAWRSGGPWFSRVLGYLEANRDMVAEVLGGIEGLVHFSPEATYLSWIDFSQLSMGEDPSELLGEKAQVVLSPGPTFGEPGKGHARLNFATPRPLLSRALERLAEACQAS